MKYLVDENYDFSDEDKKNASSKAREDIKDILIGQGVIIWNKNIIRKKDNGIMKKICYHFKSYCEWKKSLNTIKFNQGDIVFFQYPMINFSFGFQFLIRKLNRKNIKTVAIIHDLNSVRYPEFKSYKNKELKVLNSFSYIIDHNSRMRNKLQEMGVNEPKIIDLELFDYLVKEKKSNQKTNKNKKNEIIVAGNLAKSKAGYLYELPSNIRFGLYGLNFESEKDNISYYGAFDPEELSRLIDGKFGLVWDGPSSKTCEGKYGEYLKINNPHKASLYISSGIPIIVWEFSALCNFVKRYKCGIMISSLENLRDVLSSIGEVEYQEILKNAERLSDKVCNGYFTKQALEKIN